MRNVKNVVRQITPPIVINMFRKRDNKNGALFSGDYWSWQDAVKDADGYDADVILQRVRGAALKVKRGEAAFERDSVVFEKTEFRWPVLACLLAVAARNGGRLHVVDFGGSLGSVYFQHLSVLKNLNRLLWSVTEQPHYVQCGRDEFEDGTLAFFSSFEECILRAPVDVVLFSGVLQNVENPSELLRNAARMPIPFFLIDRTPFIDGLKDRITLQKVPEVIFPASLPHWFLARQKFDVLIQDLGLIQLAEWPTADHADIKSQYKGFFYERHAIRAS